MSPRDPRVDAYIAQSAGFAQPILTHIRETVHATCPEVVETMKWRMPHFDHHGMMCGMAAFKSHCSLGFWKAALIPGLAPNSNNGGDSMGNLGRLTSVKDLPPTKVLAGYIREAMRLNDEGIGVARPKKSPKAEAKVPPELAAALAKHRKAKAVFDAFPASHRREYIEWIAEAKRDETRARRVAQTVEWVADGKQRNWKYL
ncbi:MAG: hypothetical protein JWN79_1204 [Gemmatimonadetes bacterium]|jgi:uncharacterized protein YdeI (YjbR/CyaY-like superfamily)|nr:hypothetical protein [Gemmatimonadota bacterium]